MKICFAFFFGFRPVFIFFCPRTGLKLHILSGSLVAQVCLDLFFFFFDFLPLPLPLLPLSEKFACQFLSGKVISETGYFKEKGEGSCFLFPSFSHLSLFFCLCVSSVKELRSGLRNFLLFCASPAVVLSFLHSP